MSDTRMYHDALLDITPAGRSVIGLPMIDRAHRIAAVTRGAVVADQAERNPQTRGALERAESAIKAARRTGAAPESEAKPASKHSWWRVSMMLYSGTTVIRNVSGKRPTVTSIKKAGWHEVRDSGDEYYAAAKAIMTIEITGFFAPNPEATPWHQVNGGR